ERDPREEADGQRECAVIRGGVAKSVLSRPVSFHGAIVTVAVVGGVMGLVAGGLGRVAGVRTVAWGQLGALVWLPLVLVLSPHSRAAFWERSENGKIQAGR